MTELDPQIVRDFARRAILSSAEDVDYIGIGEQFGEDENWPQGDSLAYDAMHDAVHDATATAIVTVSWPDEPLAAEQDGDVRAVRALTNATGRMLTKWSEANEAVRREMWTEVHDRAHAVDERFRERFAELDAAQVALDARDAKGGE